MKKTHDTLVAAGTLIHEYWSWIIFGFALLIFFAISELENRGIIKRPYEEADDETTVI